MGFFAVIARQRRSALHAIVVVAGLILLCVLIPFPPHPTKDQLLPYEESIHPPIPHHTNSRLLPFRYWHHRSLYPERYTDKSCMKFPAVSELDYAATTWQFLNLEQGRVYIYGAYWDSRFEEPLVRILIYADVEPMPKLYCQLWFPNDNEPQTELAELTYGWQPAWFGGPHNGVNEPYVMTCRCRRHKPEPDIPPIATAVVTEPCGVATNVLDVQNAPFEDSLDFRKQEPKHEGTSVAVCVKWLHFKEDKSVSVIEWLQLILSFGAKKAFIYIVRVHPNTRKVLAFYEAIGLVVVTEISHPPQVSGLHQSRFDHDYRDMRRELLPLNDCLYRNLGQYDWLAVFDLDEMIIPAPETTWAALIDREAALVPKGESIDAIVFPNYYVLDGAQKDLLGPAQTKILSHTWRSRNPSPPDCYVKSFFNVSSVTAMHNHAPMACKDECRKWDMLNKTGKLLHFRNKCCEDQDDCEALHDVVRESILDRWRVPVLKEIEEVMGKLGLGSLQ